MTNFLKGMAGLFAGLTLLVLVAAGGAGFVLWQAWQPAPVEDEVVVVVPRGIGVGAIGEILAAEDLVPSRWHLMVWSLLLPDDRSLKAGEYAFPPGATGGEIIGILRAGRTIQHTLTIPEGRTSFEIVELLRADDRLTGEIEAIPPEGALLPETYAFTRGDGRQSLVDRMESEMSAAVERLWTQRDESIPLETPQDAVILASIIEKETGVAGERDLVSSVFINRLRQDMPLQSDPTVIYALTEGREALGRTLFRSDWDVDHPYNTYRNDGLPPGPIANPGVESLRAAMNPAESNYLYFVADGTGGHAFAQTLAEHNRNVAAWRRVRDRSDPPDSPDSEDG